MGSGLTTNNHHNNLDQQKSINDQKNIIKEFHREIIFSNDIYSCILSFLNINEIAAQTNVCKKFYNNIVSITDIRKRQLEYSLLVKKIINVKALLGYAIPINGNKSNTLDYDMGCVLKNNDRILLLLYNSQQELNVNHYENFNIEVDCRFFEYINNKWKSVEKIDFDEKYNVYFLDRIDVKKISGLTFRDSFKYKDKYVLVYQIKNLTEYFDTTMVSIQEIFFNVLTHRTFGLKIYLPYFNYCNHIQIK